MIAPIDLNELMKKSSNNYIDRSRQSSSKLSPKSLFECLKNQESRMGADGKKVNSPRGFGSKMFGSPMMMV